MNLKGRVEQINELTYPTYQDLLQKRNAKKSMTRFNEKGLITKKADFLSKNITYWMRYQYKGDSIWVDGTKELNNVTDPNQQTKANQAHWLFKVDEQGLVLEMTAMFLDSSINFHTNTVYNADGKATEITYSQQKHPEQRPCRISKSYDKQGKLKEELVYHYNRTTKDCDKPPIRSVFTLNEQDDIVREVVYLKNGTKAPPHSYHLNYDKKGNWTSKTHYVGDNTKEVIFRKFTYFEDSATVN